MQSCSFDFLRFVVGPKCHRMPFYYWNPSFPIFWGLVKSNINLLSRQIAQNYESK